MSHPTINAINCLIWFLMTGCAVSDRALEIAELDGDVITGKTLYEEHCEACHGSDGTERPSLLRPDIIDLTKAEHADIIIERMEDRGPRTERTYLSNQEIADIIAYVLVLQGIETNDR